MRAFLSHSSLDKNFVGTIAKELGRQFCEYDEYSFATGEEFRAAIRSGLDDSSIFVFIASKNSLSSTWVKFEQDEAELRLIQGALSRVLVFLMPDGTQLSDLPEWMKKAKVSEAVSAKAVVKEIQHHIQSLYLERQQPIYVGRQKERTEAEEKLLSMAEAEPPRSFLAWGLAGIGRRTFCARIASDLFNLRKHSIFRIQEGDNIKDIVIKLADQAEVTNTIGEFKSIVEDIRQENDDDSLSRAIRYAETLAADSVLPVFLDNGGAIVANGDFSPAMVSILRQLGISKSTYYAFVSTRKPRMDSLGSPSPNSPVIRIEPLSSAEIARLVGRLADGAGVKMSRDEVKEISEYLRGYPPAAHFAIDLIKNYGVDAILANKVAIATFQSRRFVAYLDKHSALTGLRSGILSLLCYYSPLPLSVIGESLSTDPAHLSYALTYLIDISLVIPDGSLYQIADPVIDSVVSVIDRSAIPHEAVAQSIEKYLAAASAEDEGILSMARALRRASLYAGLTPSENEIQFVSDLVDLQQRNYHARDYDASIRFGREALIERPENAEVRSYLVRALAQVERYQEAIDEIEPIREMGLLHDAYFLTGFVERLRGNFPEAINAYLESLRRGRRGVAIQRELALCYFLINNYEEAKTYLEGAEALQSDNRYLVDLQIQIAVRLQDFNAALVKLAILKEIDKEEFYLHRKSTVELASGDVKAALESIKGAIALTDRPTAAMLAQAAKCAIDVRDFDSAETCLSLFKQRFPRRSADALPAIECRYEIARGKYEDAIALLESKVSKNSPVYVLLRLRAVTAILTHRNLDASAKKVYEKEREILSRTVESEKIVDIDSGLH